ncbi:D-alanyl-D-alanine carboxypeptidase/D-alanyl-D-alanine-endopeptidase [Alloacidobacterium dinghuense]|uniref:D-alanyl-D-alanine carboxypeptidase/D-alanyl-D-alanine-endopeptidase n=1 Tax=Alloacidobacterium dinghuense TaxID=2763107 RepID=A0A7G8BFD9_9BACT|nr:D-alanyl-D-alanine carboxypeptidase/D-alanyl-D-alanine-endopeptidase [Alloacidobacterium dinghuense]QNI31259.1 D-alanyl-D-alanine carboxypeptidase/D-alanyl-D-alanine-endopeptidase [Alloacidobacterium dinghuense]
MVTILRTQAMTRCLFLCLTGLLSASAFAKTHDKAKPTNLAQTITAILSAPAIARAHWGISVVTLEGQPIYSLNDQQYFQPASNAKLFTTAAALALLGPDFTIKTYVVAEGPVSSDGQLRGSLRFIGGGDPTISDRIYPYSPHSEHPNQLFRALDDLAAQVAASGIRSLDGTIVADDTVFAWERYGQGWAQDDLQWDYGAPVSALTVNDNVRYLTLASGAAAGDAAIATWNPLLPDDSANLKNDTTTSPAGSQQHLGLDRQPDQTFLRAYGTIPAGSKPATFAIAVQDAAKTAGDEFAQALTAHGVVVSNTVQASHRLSGDTQIFEKEAQQSLALKPMNSSQPDPIPLAPGARIVAERTSPPLSQIVTVVNKVSQNLHAEILLRLLGKAEGDDGSVVQGTRVVRQFLVSAGVQPDDFFFYDGSGLSPQDVITPRAATTLLSYATRQSWGAVYRDSLPVGGVDGTLENRFKQPPLKGKVFAKTGTLAEVHALSGYLTAASGRTLVFSILCNDHSPVTDTTRAAMDNVVAAIAAAN